MRTTLDLDEDVLEAAKELARAERKTVGSVASDLMRKGLTAPIRSGPLGPNDFVLEDGWYVLPNREGVVVTKEMVDRLIEEADLEDAAISLEK